ncbi:hypothetical protein [Breznakiella homolactica]|uniref:Uncharacterized protein n=1 Tax=Breznakiella homolactica TaxID=2798577 RepID=A0A7T7XJN1_9SPIR|nr:hypothetical protein [Breznakiella homolactica]QQO07649.1 hypothetical protein JFL75_11900 [Breznakiella homolactica]
MKKRTWFIIFIPVICLVIFAVWFLVSFRMYIIPYHTVFYENKELEVWTDSYETWTLDDEKWLMRGYDRSPRKRADDTVSHYQINGALCYAGIRAKDETTTYSQNPYGIGITVWGILEEHISFTVKYIGVNSGTKKDVSAQLNKELPQTVVLKNESQTGEGLVWGYYHTEEILEFQKKPVTLEFILEVETVDGPETGHLFFTLTPEEHYGLFQVPSV